MRNQNQGYQVMRLSPRTGRSCGANHQQTYGEKSPCPCDDCTHLSFCLSNGKTCKVSRHWETYGKVLYTHRTGWQVKQGIEREPEKRMPDGEIEFVKHSWNSKSWIVLLVAHLAMRDTISPPSSGGHFFFRPEFRVLVLKLPAYLWYILSNQLSSSWSGGCADPDRSSKLWISFLSCQSKSRIQSWIAIPKSSS